MGAMPFSKFFEGRGADAARRGDSTESAFGSIIGEAEKLALVDDLESSGASMFWSTDSSGRLAYLSPAILALLDRDPASVLGQPMQSVFAPIEGDGDSRSLSLKLGSRKAFANFAVASVEKGIQIVLRLSGSPFFASGQNFQGFRGTGFDITEEFRSDEEAARLSKFDSLTGLSNRHRMEQRIDSTLAAFRNAKRAAAVMMLDLDRFKQVNDTLGHAAGDQLLRQVAERLNSVVAGRGEIGRLGGDEFQVLIPDMDDRGELGEIAKKIITMTSQPYSVDEGRCTIGCSVGIAIAPYDGLERDELSRAADLALYASKNGGRGQFRFYAADLEHEANLRKRMEEDLATAIESGDFTLEYQPLVALDDNRVVALEAHYCWEDQDRGRVGEETFLPVADGSRLIVPIGEWALRKACEDALQWPESLRVTVKITPVQFAANGFADMVALIVEDTGIDPSRLELELKETILQGDPSAVDTILSALFKLGVRLSIGDFGSGFTSLGYLRRAPFSALKIGEGFFEPSLGREHGDMGMVGAISALAKALGMEVSAGGVHALGLLAELKQHGVGFAEGFVFSEAVPADKVLEEIARGEWSIAPTETGTQRATRRTVFRKIGVIHEDFYYDVTLRNLSRSGAMIQGLEGVPVGTMFVLDFGQGQLAVGTVKRVMDDTQGIEFEQDLVDDGAGGLCTRSRVSPYELAAAGAPLQALPPGKHGGTQAAPNGFAQFKLSDNAPSQTGSRD